jgi:O-antigen ligase
VKIVLFRKQWAFLFPLLFYLSFFLTAWHIYFGFAIKPFFILAFIYLIFNLKSIRFRIETHEIFMLLFFTYYFLTGIFSADIVNSFRLILGGVITIVIYFLMKDFLKKQDKKNNIQNIIIVSAFLFSFLSLFLYIKGLIIVNGNLLGYEQERVFGVLIERGMPRLIGTMIDPNFYFMSSIFFFFFLLHIPYKSAFIIVTLLLLIFSMMLTISTGGMISIIMILIPLAIIRILNLLKQFTIPKKYIKIIFLAVTACIFLITFYTANEFILNILSKRIDNLSEGSGRFDIWKNGLSIWMQNPIMGIGIYNFRYYNGLYFNDYQYMHNTHLEVLVESGLIGFALYTIFLISVSIVILFIISKDRKYTYLLTSYLALLIMMLSLSQIINEILFLFFAYVSFIFVKERGINYETRNININNASN